MNEKKSNAEVLSLFFKPKSIAIIGLSRKALDSPVSILTTITDFGYRGDIYIVNPKFPTGGDLEIFPDLSSIKKPVDLAILSVARSRVLDTLKECVRNDIKAAVVITQGFADADEEGRRLQQEMKALSMSGGIRILGPNTMGVMNAFADFTSSFFEVRNEKIPIGLIAQSGLFMMGYHMMKDVPAGFGMAMDLGNVCDIGFADVLEYYEKDENIKIIMAHMEAVDDGKAFMETASRVSCKKPIIVLKSGKSKTGKRAVISHSGKAAGETEVYDAAFKKAGVVTASNTEELRLLAKAFVTYPPIKGQRIAVVTFSGAAGILSIDAIEGAGLRLAEFSKTTVEAIKGFFPLWMEVKNPLDVWMAVSSHDFHETYPRILEGILKDRSVDAVICIYISFTLPKHDEYDSSRHILALAEKYPGKPILCWSYGLNVQGFTEAIERDGKAMVFPSLESAARTLRKLAEYGATRDGLEKGRKIER
jgi:acetate---CoA ligase (ADP-forming)